MPTDPTYPLFSDAELTEWANMLRAYDHEYFTLATADLRQLFATLDQRARERDEAREKLKTFGATVIVADSEPTRAALVNAIRALRGRGEE